MARNNLRGDRVVTATEQGGGVVPATVSVLDAWISDPNAELAQFLTEDVPALAGLPDPWTIDGLRRTAQAAWHAFSSDPALLCEPDSQHRLDRYVRYVGELYRRTLNGHWHNAADGDDAAAIVPVVQCPGGMVIDPRVEVVLLLLDKMSRPDTDPETRLLTRYHGAKAVASRLHGEQPARFHLFTWIRQYLSTPASMLIAAWCLATLVWTITASLR